jgi:hypothetical protein
MIIWNVGFRIPDWYFQEIWMGGSEPEVMARVREGVGAWA